MIHTYIILKKKPGYWRLTTDTDLITVYIFEDTIQEIDLDNISDFVLQKLKFEIPILFDYELFENSEMKEGFTIKPIRLDSIRKAEWLRKPNQP